MTLGHLRQLNALITESIARIEKTCAEKKSDIPPLDSIFNETHPAHLVTLEDNFIEASNIIVAAADQLIATVRRPVELVTDAAQLYQISSALATVTELGVVEVLREAGHKGLQVNELGNKVGVDGRKLARILRLLATNHIFKEVMPDVFVNNRHSSFLDTTKSFTEIQQDRGERFTGLSGAAAAFIGYSGQDVLRSSTEMYNTLVDQKTARSYKVEDSSFNRAFKTDEPFYQFIERPENRYMMTRFGNCVRVASLWTPPDALCQAYDWPSLKEGSKVLDIGGGVGAPMLPLAKAFPHLKIIIEDREAVFEHTRKFFNNELPGSIQSGQISCLAHDFFTPQPLADVSVFHLRAVTHNWPDNDVIRILKCIRAAAAPESRLISSDYIIPFVCEDTTNVPHGIPRLAPEPLLANLGRASMNAYGLDLMMMLQVNGQQRSLQHFDQLLRESGWKIIDVKRTLDTRFGHIVSAPN